MTVRRAIDELISEGIIRSIRGKGLYVVAKTQTGDIAALIGFREQMAVLGRVPTTRILKAELVTASTVLAQTLRVEVSSMLVYLQRLRLADGQPFSVTSAYLPHALCPGLLDRELVKDSLFATLRERYGLQLVRAVSYVQAVLADDEQAQLLEIPRSSALLLREQITYLATGEVIEFSRNFIRGDKYHIKLEEGSGRL